MQLQHARALFEPTATAFIIVEIANYDEIRELYGDVIALGLASRFEAAARREVRHTDRISREVAGRFTITVPLRDPGVALVIQDRLRSRLPREIGVRGLVSAVEPTVEVVLPGLSEVA
jgi:hypothetical protein